MHIFFAQLNLNNPKQTNLNLYKQFKQSLIYLQYDVSIWTLTYLICIKHIYLFIYPQYMKCSETFAKTIFRLIIIFFFIWKYWNFKFLGLEKLLLTWFRNFNQYLTRTNWFEIQSKSICSLEVQHSTGDPSLGAQCFFFSFNFPIIFLTSLSQTFLHNFFFLESSETYGIKYK